MERRRYNFDGHKLIYHLDRVHDFLATGDCYPLYLEISPVGSCNHRCLFCAYDFIGYPDRKLDTARTLRLLEELAACGLKSILFAGEGEPLLHPDIVPLVTHAKEAGIDVGLFTNGHLLNPAVAEKLLPALTFVRCSFNGGNRDNYARIHRVKPEVFDRVVANLREAAAIKKRQGLTVDIGAQFVLLPENIAHLPAAVATIREVGVDYIAIKPFVQQSALQGYRMAEPFPEKLLEERLAEAEKLATSSFAVMARRTAFAQYGKRGYCHCYGTSFIAVLNSAGDLASCLPYWDRPEFLFGNIYRQSFLEIWHGAKREAVHRHLTETLDAGGCPPNCRPHAVNEFLWDLKFPTVKHINFV